MAKAVTDIRWGKTLDRRQLFRRSDCVSVLGAFPQRLPAPPGQTGIITMFDEHGRNDASRNLALTEIADAVLAAESASDAILAATGSLLTRAVGNRVATGVPVKVAQRVLDQLEKMVISQFDSRRALLAAHSSLSAIARVTRAAEEATWGPDSTCPLASTGAEVVELRSVA
ncbi:hypothetical protein AB5I39_08580 [Sphingomonas sp. MMS24-J45]|uniref:hypothetical protein n=1 Tax=Sphingomonas sp. MMS24-J45 TaxID=3238806 RepID=UPI00384C1051